MAKKGFDQSGTILVKNRKEAVRFYKEIFGMEEIYFHMSKVLTVNGKHFFEIEEVPEEQHDAYMKAISSKNPILGTWVQYETEEEARKIYKQLTAEAIFAEELRPLPWCPCTAMLIDKYGVRWYISVPQHMPCSDCTKATCEGDFNNKCRLSKWTVELYKEHGAEWHKHI